MKNMKKIIAVLAALAIIFSFAACSKSGNKKEDANTTKTFTVGICNYVDDASLNQIVKNIEEQLVEAGKANNVTFNVKTENCNADPNVMNQIISNFINNDKVDLMVGVATPVAMAMQAATEDNKIPVVFAAVSDPVGAELVADANAPGANVTGTSDYLDTDSILRLISAAKPETKNVALLYDMGQDSSKTPIENAKKFLNEKHISYKEYNGSTVDEVKLAVDSIIKDDCDAVFTPSDNTIMTAELSIYEKLADAGIPHFAGADSFALNGAFVGYGVDYAALGRDTADMVADILVNEKDPATYPVKFFDNGTATINTEIAAKLGYNLNTLKESFKAHCSEIKEIQTAESFE